MGDLPPGIFRLCGKYRLKGKIGSGSHGDVYLGTNVLTDEAIAAKLESASNECPTLRREFKIYKMLGDYKGIPQALWFGTERGYNAIIMNRLGPSLEELFNCCDRRFGLKTVLLLADQLISHLEYIHDKNIVHRDIKPENLLVGTGIDEGRVYIVDFGLANQYFDPTLGQHILPTRKSTITGTMRYLSVHTHRGVEHGRRDDLESLAYVLIYFLRGSLPWQNINARSRKKKCDSIMKTKVNTPIATLCKGQPDAFSTLLSYARGLAFDARPDYQYLRTIFKNEFHLSGYHGNHTYDWTTTCPVFCSSLSCPPDGTNVLTD